MNKTALTLAIVGVTALGIWTVAGARQNRPTRPQPPAARATFAQVQAVFKANCVSCHQGAAAQGGIDLTTYEAVMKGGKKGKIVVPRNAKASLLVQSMQHQKPAMAMPPGRKLPAPAIRTVEAWVAAGAKK